MRENRIRRWEDLNTDCLFKIFEEVGLESLIIDIPFVCKSWYKASLEPLLYKVLHFQVMPVEERTTWATITAPRGPGASKKYSKLPPSTGFIKIAVKRSCGMATEVVFPEFLDDFSLQYHFTESALNYATLVYVLEWCPALKTLIVPYYSFFKAAESTDGCLSNLKNLQSILTLTNDVEFITYINPLNVRSVFVQASRALRRILSGCRKLELLDVTNCKGFDGDDAMILKCASHIEIFMLEGSSLFLFVVL